MSQGRKDDNGKPRWDLLPSQPLGLIARVLTFGAQRYGANNWQLLKGARSRYFAATQRHLAAWRQGEKVDAESGLPHLAHAGCCLLFMLAIEEGLDPVLDSDEEKGDTK